MQPLTKEQIQELASSYSCLEDFRRDYHKEYRRAVNKKWWKEISTHMKPARRVSRSIDDVLKVAYQYDKYIDFIRNQPKMYIYAKRYGWLPEVTKHMIKNRQWHGTQEELNELINVAKQYRTREEFQDAHPGFYYAAVKHNWLTIISKHMDYYPEKNPHKKNKEYV